MNQQLNIINKTIVQLNKQYGEHTVFPLSDSHRVQVDVIPSGSLDVDLALGVGGFPRGRIVEIVGDEATGKTTLAIHAVAQAQRLGHFCAYVDVEHALDPAWMRLCGVNMEMFYLSQPDSAESALDIAEQLIRSGGFALVVIDSVAQLVPKAELEGNYTDSHVAIKARLMGQALRRMTPAINQTNTAVIFINQFRLKIGVSFGDPRVTPGGKALQFAASVRLFLSGGANRKAKMQKNKVATPFREGWFDIGPFGIDPVICAVRAAYTLGLVKTSGSWLTVNGQKYHGYNGFVAAMAQDYLLFCHVWDMVRHTTHSTHITKPTEEEFRSWAMRAEQKAAEEEASMDAYLAGEDITFPEDSQPAVISDVVEEDTAEFDEVDVPEDGELTPAVFLEALATAALLEKSGAWYRIKLPIFAGKSFHGWDDMLVALTEDSQLMDDAYMEYLTSAEPAE